MRSIQTKFIALILTCVLLAAMIIGGAGILSSDQVAGEASAQMMNLLCSEKAQGLDAQLSRIEQSVQTLALYTTDQLDDLEQLKTDRVYMDTFTQKLEAVAVNAANNTEGAVAVYVRYNPAFAAPTSGLFWSKTSLDGRFSKLTPTDLSSYSPSDVEHVGWYYIPVKTGKPLWMAPYYNQNIDIRMISYVIPIYMNNETIGVVGMDIDFDILVQNVAGMRVYQTGNAFLTDSNAKVLYHQELPINVLLSSVDSTLAPVMVELENGTSGSALFSYDWRGEEKRMAFRSLRNGMRLAITAPASEIDKDKNALLVQILVAIVVISCVSVLLTVLLTRRIIRPLRELNTAAQKIAAGDLSISLVHQTKDEVGTLADSFQQTVNHLRKYIDYINGLAYRDSLTGVKNKTAYQDAVQRMEERMRMERPAFAVVVLDINGLKQVNDHFGHDFGDMLIIDACKIICKSFKRSPVYRIGGDEFVAILEGVDLEIYPELLDKFQQEIADNNKNSRDGSEISIARGIAVYSYETDLVFGNVFKRADDAMYQNKAAMKQQQVDDADAVPG